MAVHNFTRLQVSLQIGSDEVPSTHRQASPSGQGGKRPEGCRAHCGTEGLFKVFAWDLRTSLHAESGFERAIPFPL
eukprot:6206681-Pleurochrysis_carterae.AAC.1